MVILFFLIYSLVLLWKIYIQDHRGWFLQVLIFQMS
jgi:hypothetical protein